MRAGIHDEEDFQAEIIKSDPHRRRQLRRVGTLELDADSASVLRHGQIEFGASVSRPEMDFIGFGQPDHLLQREALPGCARSRMRQKRSGIDQRWGQVLRPKMGSGLAI